MEKVTLRVPATTANMGPGFDCVGCALSLYNTVTFEKIDDGVVIDGCPDEFRTPDNLTIVAYKKALEYLQMPFSGVKATIRAEIPMSRGLGSSAALIVAGVMAANILYNGGLSTDEIIDIATEVEGHPDNIAPAMLGGLTASFLEDGKSHTVKYDIHKKWNFVAAIPDFKLSTAKARSVLPDTVLRNDAVFNISRVAVGLKAFETGQEDILKVSLGDKLHQPYRKSLITEYETVEKIAGELGVTAFYLSGAGPTLMCISTDSAFKDNLNERIKKECQIDWQILPLDVDNNGASIM